MLAYFVLSRIETDTYRVLISPEPPHIETQAISKQPDNETMPPPQGTPNILEGPGKFSTHTARLHTPPQKGSHRENYSSLTHFVPTRYVGDYTVTKTVHSDTYPAIDPSSLDPSLLKGRAVYIGGASRGIGKAIAISFARGGASLIAISARSKASLEPVAEELKATARDASALRVVCVAVEASSPESVAAAADAVARECGGRPLDIVVQNAAVLGTNARITDADPDEWWRVYEVNVRGQFLAAKYFLPLLLQGEGQGGLRTFVTVASVGAHLVGEGYSHYQSGKLANLRIAEFVDREYGPDGVSAWCVHPGNVLTDMAGGVEGEVAKTMSQSESCPANPHCVRMFLSESVLM